MSKPFSGRSLWLIRVCFKESLFCTENQCYPNNNSGDDASETGYGGGKACKRNGGVVPMESPKEEANRKI